MNLTVECSSQHLNLQNKKMLFKIMVTIMDLLKYTLDNVTDKKAIEKLNSKTEYFKADTHIAWYDKEHHEEISDEEYKRRIIDGAIKTFNKYPEMMKSYGLVEADDYKLVLLNEDDFEHVSSNND